MAALQALSGAAMRRRRRRRRWRTRRRRTTRRRRVKGACWNCAAELRGAEGVSDSHPVFAECVDV
eukprot:1207643-Heterocapsa_arctica.AAC.1